MNEYYYYDPQTGVFLQRSNCVNCNTDLPYIEKPQGWRYCDYRVNVETQELIYEPYAVPQRR